MSMTGKTGIRRVQVYLENPKIGRALELEARAAKLPMSRAAERAIARGLQHRPVGDPEDRLLALERAQRDHMRAMARDMTFVQELIVQLVREFFIVLPDRPADREPLLLAAVEARVQRFIDATAARIAGGGSAPAAADEPARPAPGSREPPPAASEARSFRAAEP